MSRAVHTLDTLMARTQEVGKCLEWLGYSANGSPQVSHGGKMHSVRRLIRELQGKPAGPSQFVGVKCKNPLCVNPDHLIARPVRDHMKHMAKNVAHTSPVRIAKLQRAAANRRVLTDEQELALILDERSIVEVAKAFGVSYSLAKSLRRGKMRQPTLAANNPFAGLMR